MRDEANSCTASSAIIWCHCHKMERAACVCDRSYQVNSNNTARFVLDSRCSVLCLLSLTHLHSSRLFAPIEKHLTEVLRANRLEWTYTNKSNTTLHLNMAPRTSQIDDTGGRGDNEGRTDCSGRLLTASGASEPSPSCRTPERCGEDNGHQRRDITHPNEARLCIDNRESSNKAPHYCNVQVVSWHAL